jgi:hypothetical protein
MGLPCVGKGEAMPDRPIKWAYCVTTVPSRMDDLLPRTLDSLRGAGFDRPHLFVDGATNLQVTKYREWFTSLDVTTRYPAVRTYGNWVLSLWELYVRNPACDRYAVFQDDFVTVRNLRAYLDRCPFPDGERGRPKGYWNLYTFPSNQELAAKNRPQGQRYSRWYFSNQHGRGAVALVFSLAGVVDLLSSRHVVTKPQDAHRGWRSADGAVVESLRQQGYWEHVHDPSLVQHTGDVSAMGNSPHKKAVSFPGEDFDALTLLQSTQTATAGG